MNDSRYTREAFTESLLNLYRQCITIEQYDASRAYLESLPDAKFEQLTAEMLYLARQQKPLTAKEFVKAMDKVRIANHVTDENTAMRRYPVSYLSEDLNAEMWRDIRRTRPSDIIRLNAEDDDALCELWKKGCSLEEGRIPSDLFFAGKVALHDCRIIVDETDLPDGQICEYRVVVFPDYQDRIKAADGDPADVGAIVMEFGSRATFIPIIVTEGMDYIGIGSCGYHNVPKEQLEASKKIATMQDIGNMTFAYMATWYGIQIALLYPTVREVFRHPRMERVDSGEPKKRGKHKRIVRYVKSHVINAEEIRNAARDKGQEYTRRTLVWYVIGHWRHYASGKKVFVQPYWKGALRHLKMDLDGREREIIIQEEETV